jgi:hypothetical protein
MNHLLCCALHHAFGLLSCVLLCFLDGFAEKNFIHPSWFVTVDWQPVFADFCNSRGVACNAPLLRSFINKQCGIYFTHQLVLSLYIYGTDAFLSLYHCTPHK